MAKKRPGRPRMKKRPVVAMRLHQDLYDKIRSSAGNRKLSMSEEIENRLQQSFQWDQSADGVRRLLADAAAAIQGKFDAALRERGYQPIHIDQGRIWAEPGMNISRMSVSVDAAAIVSAMEPELAEILARALAKVSKKGDQS
jgi:hypothetical protein